MKEKTSAISYVSSPARVEEPTELSEEWLSASTRVNSLFLGTSHSTSASPDRDKGPALQVHLIISELEAQIPRLFVPRDQ
jgi:hypothetical protein